MKRWKKKTFSFALRLCHFPRQKWHFKNRIFPSNIKMSYQNFDSKHLSSVRLVRVQMSSRSDILQRQFKLAFVHQNNFHFFILIFCVIRYQLEKCRLSWASVEWRPFSLVAFKVNDQKCVCVLLTSTTRWTRISIPQNKFAFYLTRVARLQSHGRDNKSRWITNEIIIKS